MHAMKVTYTMNPTDLDTAYTALANAIHAVGKEQESLFLATLCLSMLSQQIDLKQVLGDITQAQRVTQTAPFQAHTRIGTY